MKYTSAEANKLLKSLKEQESQLLTKEAQGRIFNAAVGENIEDVRPKYNFDETQVALINLQEKIRRVKHAINVFNTTTVVTDGITIDEVLILLPQLSERAEVLRKMALTPKQTRAKVFGMGSANVIDYTYANYDPEYAKTLLNATQSKIDRFQLALDQVNNTVTMEINL